MITKKSNVENFFNRYICKKNTIIFLIILMVFSVILLAFSSYNINSISLETSASDLQNFDSLNNKYKIWCTFKDVAVVFLSITGLNLLISVFIERRNKNEAFEDFFMNDIISSPSFYNHLSEDEKEKMLHALESNYYFADKNIPKHLYNSITEKLKLTCNQNWYMEKCSFDINCYIHEDHIEKRVIKSMTISSFSDNDIIDRFRLLKTSSDKVSGKRAIDLIQVKVNHKELDINRDIINTENKIENQLDLKAGCSYDNQLFLKQKLNFKKSKRIPIEISYVTRVPLSDLSYVCRMSAPCKQFSLNLEIKNNNSYKVSGYAFGFIDDARHTPNHDDDSQICIQFNDWIFPSDGVAIFLSQN